MTYEAYIKSFYNDETENVFTSNSWTLSDNVIELFKGDFFYRQHVRWNVRRYRPCDLTEVSTVDKQSPVVLTDVSQPLAPDLESNNGSHGLAEKQTDQFDEVNQYDVQVHSLASANFSKRKRCRSEDIPDRLTRAQSRMMKQKKIIH